MKKLQALRYHLEDPECIEGELASFFEVLSNRPDFASCRDALDVAIAIDRDFCVEHASNEADDTDEETWARICVTDVTFSTQHFLVNRPKSRMSVELEQPGVFAQMQMGRQHDDGPKIVQRQHRNQATEPNRHNSPKPKLADLAMSKDDDPDDDVFEFYLNELDKCKSSNLKPVERKMVNDELKRARQRKAEYDNIMKKLEEARLRAKEAAEEKERKLQEEIARKLLEEKQRLLREEEERQRQFRAVKTCC
jgi:hypothetical protein